MPMGQNGTLSALELKNLIKSTLKEIGWTQERLAAEVMTASDDHYTDEEADIFYTNFRRNLNRMQSVAKLQGYLAIIQNHPAHSERFCTVNYYHPIHSDADDILDNIRAISTKLTKSIEVKLQHCSL